MVLRGVNEGTEEFQSLESVFPAQKFSVTLFTFQQSKVLPFCVISLVTVSDFIKLGF